MGSTASSYPKQVSAFISYLDKAPQPPLSDEFSAKTWANYSETADQEKIPVPLLLRMNMQKMKQKEPTKSSYDQFFEMHSLQMFT